MRARRGNQAVEFALVCPILLVLLAGIVDVGQYLYVSDGLVNSVAQGGRLGALANPDDSEDPVATAVSMTNASWVASELPGTLTTSAVVTGTNPDKMLQVQGTVTFSPFFGFLTLPTNVTYTHYVRLMYPPP